MFRKLITKLSQNIYSRRIIAGLLILFSISLVWLVNFDNYPSISDIQFLDSGSSFENFGFKNKSILSKSTAEGSENSFTIKFVVKNNKNNPNFSFKVQGCVSEIFVNKKPVLNPVQDQKNFEVAISQQECQTNPVVKLNLNEYRNQNGISEFEILSETTNGKISLNFSKIQNVFILILVLILIFLSVILFILI